MALLALVTHLRDHERGNNKTRLCILQKLDKGIRLHPLEERKTIHGHPPDAFPRDSVVSIAYDVFGEFASLDEVRIPWSLLCIRIICIRLVVHCRRCHCSGCTRLSTRVGTRRRIERERLRCEPAREFKSGFCGYMSGCTMPLGSCTCDASMATLMLSQPSAGPRDCMKTKSAIYFTAESDLNMRIFTTPWQLVPKFNTLWSCKICAVRRFHLPSYNTHTNVNIIA